MKRILIILILCTGVANAQKALTTTNPSKLADTTINTEEKSSADSKENRIGFAEDIENDTVCYGETSKVAFFEALIARNNFDIELKDSEAVAIKSTEEMISKLKERTLLASIE